jgi:exopolysaccharide biosynthesis polyprenyl glycosylphosphotransferase
MYIAYDLIVLIKLASYGQYDVATRFSRVEDLCLVAKGALSASALSFFIAVATQGYFSEYYNYSRPYIALAFAIPAVGLITVRWVGVVLQRRAFAAGNGLRTVLIVGSGARRLAFSKWIERHAELGRSAWTSDIDVATSVHESAAILDRELDLVRPDELVLAFDAPEPELQCAVMGQAAARGIRVRTLPGVFESYQSEYFEFGGTPITTVFDPHGRSFVRNARLLLDRMIAGLALLLLAPFFATVALAIKLDSRGPIFFAHSRRGLHGRRFKMFKFRTMRSGADDILADALCDPALLTEWRAFHKLKDDPRVTRVGRTLRRLSIDELPQLVNVLLGEMSLVGPRPIVDAELDKYGSRFVFSQVRPGMTGLWQISGRNDVTYDERIALDVYYAENWSYRLDLLILMKTLPAILRRSGAY